MTSMLKPDICVIGGGASGVSAAMEAIALGRSVVLVEKHAVGGQRLKRHVPTQALLAAARHAQSVREGERFGIGAANPEINARMLSRHIGEAVKSAAPDISAERLIALGVRFIQAEADFRDSRTIVAGNHEIRPGHAVIATGTEAVTPAIEGIGDVDVLSPETALGLTRLPSRLILIGAGSDGLPLSQAYARLGSAVTVIDEGDALPNIDPELTNLALPRLRADGVDMRMNTRILHAARRGKTGVRLHIEGSGEGQQTIDATHLLVATGRAPALAGLKPEAAGIAVDDGRLRLDRQFRTTNRRVFAVGSVAGAVHVTAARSIVRAIARREKPATVTPVAPRVIHTDPPIACVGMDEAAARQEHRTLRILRWPLSETDRARAERRPEGLVKLLADSKERILGVGIVGAQADEAIAVWSLALANGLTVRDMSAHAPAQMTFGEAGVAAARSYFKDERRRPAMHRMLKALGLRG